MNSTNKKKYSVLALLTIMIIFILTLTACDETGIDSTNYSSSSSVENSSSNSQSHSTLEQSSTISSGSASKSDNSSISSSIQELKRSENLVLDTESNENLQVTEILSLNFTLNDVKYISFSFSSDSNFELVARLSSDTTQTSSNTFYNDNSNEHKFGLLLSAEDYTFTIKSNSKTALNISYIATQTEIETIELSTKTTINYEANQTVKVVSFVPSQIGYHSIVLSNAKDMTIYNESLQSINELNAVTNARQNFESTETFYIMLSRTSASYSHSMYFTINKASDAVNATEEGAIEKTINQTIPVEIDTPGATLYYKLNLDSMTFLNIKGYGDTSNSTFPLTRIYDENKKQVSLNGVGDSGIEYNYSTGVLPAGAYTIAVYSSDKTKTSTFNVTIEDPRSNATYVSYNSYFTVYGGSSQSEQWFKFSFQQAPKTSDENSFQIYAKENTLLNFYTGSYHGKPKLSIQLFNPQGWTYKDTTKTKVVYAKNCSTYDFSSDTTGTINHVGGCMDTYLNYYEYSTYYFCIRLEPNINASENFMITNNELNLYYYK